MLENQSVEEIQNNIKSREISIKEVIEYYLDRIDKFNPYLNSKHFLKIFCKDYNRYKEIIFINNERFWWRK